MLYHNQQQHNFLMASGMIEIHHKELRSNIIINYHLNKSR